MEKRSAGGQWLAVANSVAGQNRLDDSSDPPVESYPLQNTHSNQPIKLLLNLARQRPARDQHPQFHVDAEGVFRQVGTGQEQRAAIGHGTLDVQDAILPPFSGPFSSGQ